MAGISRRLLARYARTVPTRNKDVTLAPRQWANVVFLWLSLATVLMPALDPFGSPLRPTQGSAFNAFTSDVSLGPSRAAPPERNRRYQSPAGGGSDERDARAQAPALTVAFIPAPSGRVAAIIFPAAPNLAPAGFIAGRVQARAPPPSRA